MSYVTFPATIPSSNIDYLSYIRDAATGVNLYTFEHGEYTLDMPLARPSQSYLLPASDAPFNPFGAGGWPLDKRIVTIKWTKLYRTGETFSLNRINLNRACADGRQVQLVMLDSVGNEWIGLGQMTAQPVAIGKESIFSMPMDISFELNPPVFRQLVNPGWFYFDSPGFYFDGTVGVDGFNWDSNTLATLALTAQSQSMIVTNTGDAIDSYCTLTVTGPYPAFDVQMFSPSGGLRAWLSWYGAAFAGLAAGDQLTINIGTGTIYLSTNNAPGVPVFDTRFAFRSTPWFGVWPGDNTLAVYGATNVTYNSSTANGSLVCDYKSTRF